MTDTTAGRGGVGIRLYVSGGEVVKRTFDQVGDSGRKMWAEIALGEKSANPAIRALSLGAGEVKQGFDGLTSRAGSAGVALGAFGFAGMAAAAALGALAIATQGAFEAMKNAADLTDTADRIGIGVEALQQWRYVADEAGVDTGTLESVMEKLNGTLGKFKMGLGDAKLKPVFEELGITKDQLRNVQTADEMLLLLSDTLGRVSDRSKQVSLARQLGAEEALPVIRMTREEIEQLMQASSDLGLVIDEETNKRLDEADRKLERAGQQMRIVRDTAVAPLADIFADAAAELAGMAVQFSEIEARAPGWVQAFMAIGRAIPGSGVIQRAGEFALGRTYGRLVGPGNTTNPNAAGVFNTDEVARGVAAFAIAPKGDFEPRGHTSRGGGGGSSAASAARQAEREAERRKREAERAAENLRRDMMTARRDATRERWSGDTPEDRAQLAKSLLALDQQERDAKREALKAELERTGALTEAAKVQLQQLETLDQETDQLKDREIIQTQRRELAAKQLQAETVVADDAIALLNIQDGLAKTTRQRFEIAKQIMALEHELERKARKVAAEADGVVTDEERASLYNLERRQQGEINVLNHQEDERLRAQFKSYGREVTDAIREGRIGEYIGDQLKQRLLDGALDQLFNLFNSMKSGNGAAGGAGAGNWLSSAFNVAKSFFGGGRAAGGGAEAGRFYHTVEHGRPELFMIGGSGHVTSAVETARMLRESMAETGGYGRAPAAAGMGEVLEVRVDKSSLFDVEVRRVAQPLAERARVTGAADAINASRRGASALQQQQRRLGK